ncbi:MAG: cellulase family glycosylhydrolase [Candidatus Marinimicrobia bacterium]|nr:cellulase family glycosylhydrolase [Candidatus Neomarinimicrobiota bacterium]
MRSSLFKTIFVEFLMITFLFSLLRGQFNRGVNLTMWFQAGSPREIQFNKFTKEDIENIKSLDCDVIRLPINLHAMTTGAPDYTIDPLFWFFLDSVIVWAEELNINLILDNHSFDPSENTSVKIGEVLKPVWRQIAERYKDRSELIYYEILNEPHGIDKDTWNNIQGEVIEEIRKIDTSHTIVVTGTDWGGIDGLKNVQIYEDKNLIYSFHFYEPFLFTHQGANWVDPSMDQIVRIPFPYNADEMPKLPSKYEGTWIEEKYNSYPSQGNENWIKNRLMEVVNFRDSKNIKVFCGEFGVYMKNSENEDRVKWYKVVREFFEDHKIPWTMWDYKGGFGLFEKGSNELFEYDLNVPLLKALKLNVPEQKEFKIVPDSVGFNIYDDYPGKMIEMAGWNEGYLDLYNSDAAIGNFCIYWTNAKRYNSIAFNFLIDKDLTYLLENNYFLVMYIKGNSPNTEIDIRFVDTKESDEDHPWRKKYTIDDNVVSWDGTWQNIAISLSDFVDGGSWDNGKWYEPVPGAFDWGKVDLFEIVAEHRNLDDAELWFDGIAIKNEFSIRDEPASIPERIVLYQNFPNPFNDRTIIKFYLPKYLNVNVEIYDLMGRKIAQIFEGYYGKGLYELSWDAKSSDGKAISTGFYICRIKCEDKIYDSINMIYMK